MDEEILLNKLELHFSKKKNDGGEVEVCEILQDSWTVVLTFTDAGGECLSARLLPVMTSTR